MHKNVAILQSNYIPWKGYFDLINSVDLFIFHDDLQYTKNDWRNRNRIKTPEGTKWLTIPAGASEKRLICDVNIPEQRWKNNHLNKIIQYYGKATHFNAYFDLLTAIYQNDIANLSDFNQRAIKYIAGILGIKTVFLDSRELKPAGRKSDRVLDIAKKVGARNYLTGPAAKNYLEEEKFAEAGIQVSWFTYDGYPEYRQLYPPSNHQVSILDLLPNEGTNAPKFMKSFTS